MWFFFCKNPRGWVEFGDKTSVKTLSYYIVQDYVNANVLRMHVLRVQAKNEKISTPTFPKWFDPRIDLAPFFRPPEFVFTCLIGLLRRPPWPPLAISPLQTGLPRTSEMVVKTGIFGSFSHILYRILPRSLRTFQIQNSSPLQKVMLV